MTRLLGILKGLRENNYIRIATMVMAMFGTLAAVNGLISISGAKPIVTVEGNNNHTTIIAKAPSICPDGWVGTVIADGHTPTRTCTKGSMTVTLYPNLNAANYGLDTKGDGTYVYCPNIPDWPAAWCRSAP